MTPALFTAALLALAVVVGWVRLGWWWHRAERRGAWWWLALLIVAQPVLAALLHLTLFPPPVRAGADPVLTVATRSAPLAAADVALPEAPGGSAPVRAPDLATALRAHPGTRRVRVLGEGLEPRDRAAAMAVAIDFAPAAPRAGLVALAVPPPVAPGAAFRVGGQAAGMAGARAELVDPAGQVADRAAIGADGSFVLTGTTRVPGVALFRLRLAGVEAAPVPVVVAAGAPVRVLYLAGAPGPEAKYWRRWAADAGLAASVSMPAGAGIELGDAAPALNAATLARYDLVVVDDRRWAMLGGGQRGALAQAVRGGLGLLVRVTGPLPGEVRAGWSAIGAPVAAVRGERPVRLGADLPVLSRTDALAADGIPLARDAAGVPFAAWRAVGRGRVGAWTLGDAFALVTSGHGARFGALWSDAVSTLARPRAEATPTVSDWPVPGERATLCGLAAGASVTDPAGAVVTPIRGDDGCAALFPTRVGWHVLRSGAALLPFHVADAAAIAALRAADRRAATLALTGRVPASSVAGAMPPVPGASWPWLLALLVVAGALWWFERRPRG